MESLDEESRPRFLFQSQSDQSQNQNPETYLRTLYGPTVFISVSISVLLISLTYFLIPDSEPFTSILTWLSISFLLAPSAPTSFMEGLISVVRGPILEPPKIVDPETVIKKNPKSKNSRVSISNGANFKIKQNGVVKNGVVDRKDEILGSGSKEGGNGDVEERKRREEDFELLKKADGEVSCGEVEEMITETFKWQT